MGYFIGKVIIWGHGVLKMPSVGLLNFLHTYFFVKIKDSKAWLWLVLSNKIDVCYLLVDVQEIRIQRYFCAKKVDNFYFTFSETPCRGTELLINTMVCV